jgi:aldehyde:ferredoxin oxidoreductase
MWTTVTSDIKQPTDYQFRRVMIDLGRGDIQQDNVSCQDLEDFLGGIGRSFKLLGAYAVTDAFAPSSPLIMNLGIFSGTEMMTGLRTFFSAYSPLKVAQNGRPLAMWSAASGDFGTRLLSAGIDEVILHGRAERPVYLLIHKDGDTLHLTLEDARDLLGQTTHDKIMCLTDRHPGSHVAALGPAGEHWQQNAYGAIACSTGNEIETRECKPRFAAVVGWAVLWARNSCWPSSLRPPFRSAPGCPQHSSRRIRKSAVGKARAITATPGRAMVPVVPGAT